jgi:hypothetical protein
VKTRPKSSGREVYIGSRRSCGIRQQIHAYYNDYNDCGSGGSGEGSGSGGG